MTSAAPDDVAAYSARLLLSVEDEASREPFLEQEQVFTRTATQVVVDVGALTSPELSYFDLHVDGEHLKINAWGHDDDEARVDLVVSVFDPSAEIGELSRDKASLAIQSAASLFAGAASGKLLSRLEPGLAEYELADQLARLHTAGSAKRLRIFLCTNRRLASGPKVSNPKLPKSLDVDAVADIWDIARLCNAESNGQPREAIEVDFQNDFGGPVACLPLPGIVDAYQSYLVIFSGKTLSELYARYGEQLLELNVRSFLQARGKVNGRIQETIKKEPELFFAYNNGLCMTAESIDIIKTPNGPAMRAARGLQIVNGGQTTASIHHAAERANLSVDKVFVQAKVSVVRAEHLETLVPQISRFANSQNKVNDSDFLANDELHRRIERLSRTVWAGDFKSYWFYERARGQYHVARAKASSTPSSKKNFDILYPSKRVFTKTDIASVLNTWDGLPHEVSKGGQKNFKKFSELHPAQQGIAASRWDAQRYRELVAKLIVFRAAQQVVKDRPELFPAYRANVVAYTVAYIARRAGSRIDLEGVYRTAAIPPSLTEAMVDVARVIAPEIKKSAGDQNVTEWCKKQGCWDHIRGLDIDIPKAFRVAVGAMPAAPDASPAVPTARVRSEWLLSTLEDAEIIDQRPDGGSLYVIGGAALSRQMAKIKKQGFSVSHLKKGNEATGMRAAWRIRPPKGDASSAQGR